MLNTLGARIDNIGSNTLSIEGVDKLHGGEFTIGPDYLEVISFVGAAVVTRGSLCIKNAGNEHLSMIKLVLKRLGVEIRFDGDDLVVDQDQELRIEPDLGNAIRKSVLCPGKLPD